MSKYNLKWDAISTELLQQFIERNINLFFSTEINNLLKK